MNYTRSIFQVKRNVFVFFISNLLLLSCSRFTDEQPAVKLKGNQIKYAKGFAMSTQGDKTLVEVYNPWQNDEILQKYVFAKDSVDVPDSLGTLIITPTNKMALLSSTYVGMVAMLDTREVVQSVANANWICDANLFHDYIDGKITDLGNDLNINPEVVILKHPDVVMKYIYKGPDHVDDMFSNAGIPVVYNIEFMEEHPLGRAEWIKLVGAIVGKKEKADSLFNVIERNYFKYKNLAKTAVDTPSVLIGNSYKGTWYAVGGKSFVAQLVEDAMGNYYWQNDSSTGGLPLNFESVYLKQKNADVWINANASSLDEILTIEPRCNVFKSLQDERVYHYNKRKNPNNGLDYNETGVVRPDLLLKDLLIILHPELFEKEEQTTYYQRLEKNR